MKRRRSQKEIDNQEEKDDRICDDLLEAKYPYRNESNEQNIKIGNERFSLHWILCYAQARNAGIACMITSAWYSNERMYDFGYEQHEAFGRPIDAKLLWQANLVLQSRGQLRKPEMAGEAA